MALNAEHLSENLADKFDLDFLHFEENFDGEVFIVIRPKDLHRPNGFGVSIARTPRRVEASLRMDNFSRSLIRRMGEADPEARNNFSMLAEISRNAGVNVSLRVNGILEVDLKSLSNNEWKMLELDCDARLPQGTINSDTLNDHAFKVLEVCTGLILSLLPIEETEDFIDDITEGLPEGARVTLEVNRYERSRINRALCIALHGAHCVVCGFDFSKIYGNVGREIIEVHHKTPVSEMGGSYRVNPLHDLAPVCANCHRVLHRKTPPFTIAELQEIVSQQRIDRSV